MQSHLVSTAVPWDFYLFKLTQPLTPNLKEIEKLNCRFMKSASVFGLYIYVTLHIWTLVYHQNEWKFLEGFYWTAKAEAKQMVTAYGYGTLGYVFYNNVARIKVFYREKATLIHAIFRSSTPYGQSNRVPTSCCVIQAVNTGRKRLIILLLRCANSIINWNNRFRI
jgi:hypothetical protein